MDAFDDAFGAGGADAGIYINLIITWQLKTKNWKHKMGVKTYKSSNIFNVLRINYSDYSQFLFTLMFLICQGSQHVPLYLQSLIFRLNS